jgi:elongation factor 2
LGSEDDNKNTKSDLTKIQGYLPVSESFGFTEDLRKNTSGQGFPQLVFSHWAPTPGALDDESSQSYEMMMAIRERKGLKPEVPLVDEYHAKDIRL